MRRVLIVGCAGSGKSTLARQLGETLGLEVIHLDAHFWRSGWQATPTPEWEGRVDDLLRGDAWVIDGNFSGTLSARLEAADTAIFLDFPRWLCLWRVLKRWRRHFGETRPDMAPGCPEKIDLEFLRWIWNYPRRSRPKTLALLKEREADRRIIILRNPREVEEFLHGASCKRVM